MVRSKTETMKGNEIMNTEVEKSRKTVRKTTRVELIKANSLLEKYLEKMPDGTVQYKDGWDDGKIAMAVALDMPRTSIGNIRNELFGPLRKEGSAVAGADPARVTALEAELNSMKEKFSQLVLLHQKLCDNLSVNRIVDVRHLRGGA